MKAKIIGRQSLEPIVSKTKIINSKRLSEAPFQQRTKHLISYFLIIITISFLFNISACNKDDVSPDELDYSIRDIDGNVYTSVNIGTQEWMVQNLKVTKYRNGDPVPHIGGNDDSWSSRTSGAYSNYFDGSSKNGRLYNWYAVNDSRKLAPEGWHIPTKDEWETLINYLGGASAAGSKMKEKGTTNWCAPNTDATNESGFNALPGEWRIDFGFATGCSDASWWTATEESNEEAINIFIFEGSGDVSVVPNQKYVGWGVRCVKD